MSIPVSHFRRRLESFINERHPNLKNAKRLIATRSVQAAQAFSSAVLAGDSETAARTKADALLFEGLLFSKYRHDPLYHCNGISENSTRLTADAFARTDRIL